MADSRYFVDVFGEIVASMRETGIITASSEVSGTYTITSENSLSNGESISIDGNDYRVNSVTSGSFNIDATTGLDFTGESWSALAPYYDYGHPVEVANTLSLKDKNPIKKYNKYPLIYLLTDIEKDHDENLVLGYTAPISVLIVNSTKKTYLSSERMEVNVKPILHPLYESLLDAMAKSEYLYENDKLKFDHKEIIRLYWGSTGIYGNQGLIFNDPLDAIELDFAGIEVIRNIYECQ